MSENQLLSTDDREQLRREARERGADPAEYVRTLLDKGRAYDALSRSRDYLIDEIRRVRTGDKSIEDVTLPAEQDGPTAGILPAWVHDTTEDEPVYGWSDLSPKDRQNLYRYLWYRRRQGAEDEVVRREIHILSGLGAKEADGSLSDTHIQEWNEPDNRPGRALDRFLHYVGNHPRV